MFPSLNENSLNSSPLPELALTIPPSTLAFLLSPAVIFPISGNDSDFAALAKDYYKLKLINI